ncbi:MAG: nuclear transport factor 2 family protein [Kordiimonas sp.]
MKKLVILFALILSPIATLQADDTEKGKVSAVLDQLHQAASDADWKTYFNLYTENSTFLGTDVSERWDKATFQKYAGQSNGWTYHLRERNIDLTPDGNSAWFDEVLDSEKYGTSRGTGVLIRTNEGWKITQYHLTFPLPNDLAAGITQQIQSFEKKQKRGE